MKSRSTETQQNLLKIQNPPPMPAIFIPPTIKNVFFLSNYRWQNSKERANRSTNNRDFVEKAKRDVTVKHYLSHEHSPNFILYLSKLLLLFYVI